ncbi:MAG: hypothetical protein KatS3mg082_3347 [Nitrospiraceae bacterium]|nr:MAG: hypothetical protein KatS3mg082_3347 [Nitrospiraceae bacterium]
MSALRVVGKLAGARIVALGLTTEKGRLLREGLWVSAGHGVAAIAALVGLRLLTELAPPSLYGTFVLVNGVLALVQGVAFGPLGQAALRFYPALEVVGGESLLRRQLVAVFWRRWQWIAAFCLGAAVVDGLIFRQVGPVAWVLVAATSGLDAWRTVEIVMHNAARRQGAYASLLAADAIGRPAGTMLMAWAIGPSLESMLLGQAAGALAALTGARLVARSDQRSTGYEQGSLGSFSDLDQKMNRFAASLVWVPLAGWLSGLADRYVVGSLLGLAQAGIYAAAYGLASRPLLVLGQITEATLRQPVYEAASRRQSLRFRRLLGLWLAVNVMCGVTWVLLLLAGGDIAARWLLASEYRAVAARLFPWIAFGYALVLANQVVERILYVEHRTGTVACLQVAGAALGVVGPVVGAVWFGLEGVAMAVPVYFGLQLILTGFIVRRRLGTV